MKTPTITAIAAIGRNRELGHHNELIWRIPEDLKRLKQLTTGFPIIMGRKTYESIGKPLPQRHNIIVSRNSDFSAPGCTVVPDLETALREAKADDPAEVFVFGGGAIYELAWPQIERLYLTRIDDEAPAADTYFPAYESDFSVVSRQPGVTDNGLAYEWVELHRDR